MKNTRSHCCATLSQRSRDSEPYRPTLSWTHTKTKRSVPSRPDRRLLRGNCQRPCSSDGAFYGLGIAPDVVSSSSGQRRSFDSLSNPSNPAQNWKLRKGAQVPDNIRKKAVKACSRINTTTLTVSVKVETAIPQIWWTVTSGAVAFCRREVACSRRRDYVTTLSDH